jgi:hypothetical protein
MVENHPLQNTADSTTTTLVESAQFSNEDISVPFAIDVHRNATKTNLSNISEVGHT